MSRGCRRLGLLGLALFVGAWLSGCGGARSASGNDVVVTGSAPAEALVPGATVVFTMVVQNIGNNAAQDVKLTDNLGGFMVLTSVTCDASGGATCPATPSLLMNVPTLPAGGTLVFHVSATVNAITSGTLSNTMSATTADDVGRLNNTATATASVVVAVNSLGVAQDAASDVAAGSSATFKVVVANPSGGTATNNVVLQWSVTAPFALNGITYTCTPAGGAVCPAAQTGAASMAFNVPTLGLSHQLVFVFTVPVPASGRGNLVSTASVTGTGDLDPSNNSSSITTLASDARNGAYQLFAADGRLYTLTVDFDGGKYTLDGNGASVVRNFSADSTGGGYTVSGNERLRTADDLVVGAHTFAGGLMPYIAARKFATSLTTLNGAFNIMSRTINADGTGAVTRAGTARFGSNSLQVCMDDYDAVQAASCGSTLKSYVLSYANNVFTAVDSQGGGSFNFQLARSAGADIILSAGASPGATTLQMLVGVTESAGLVTSTVYGPAIYPGSVLDWVQIDLSDPTTYVLTGTQINGLAGLFRLDNTSPTSMLQGAPSFTDAVTDVSLPALDGAPVWVMQGYPLIVVFGATKSEVDQANASGLLQIGLP